MAEPYRMYWFRVLLEKRPVFLQAVMTGLANTLAPLESGMQIGR